MFKDQIISSDSEIRLDKYLLKYLDLNRSKIKKLIDSGKILVNGKNIKAGYIVQVGDIIDIEYEDELYLKPEDINFDVLFEDEDIAVISKPQNLVVHPGAGNYDHTLVNGLLYRFNKLSDVDPLRPGIVHRLDKDTSGLMIIAKSNDAYYKLVEDFKDKRIEKTYIAIVEGITESSGEIDAPIGRDPRNRLKMKVTESNSKSAITKYIVKEYFDVHTLLELDLITGRTHQIRVHMSYINHPVVGDLVYGRKNKYGVEKQLLHSYRLRFTHPISGKFLEFEDDFPTRFTNFIDKIKF